MITSAPPRASRLPSCSRCQRPLAPGSLQCSHCAPTASASPKPTTTVSSANVWHRPLVSLLVDFFLGALTLGVGWLVWALVIFSRRQSPGGQLLGLTVVDHRTGGIPPSMAYGVRLFAVFAFSVYLVAGAVWGYGLLIDVGGYWLNSQVIPFVILAILTLDLALLAVPGHRRGIDRLLALSISSSPGVRRDSPK